MNMTLSIDMERMFDEESVIQDGIWLEGARVAEGIQRVAGIHCGEQSCKR
jgi:hypothetical protein